MLTEILKIQARLDELEANQLENKLNSRFSRIAKGFGRGLKIAAVASLGAAVLDKLINPLQEVKAAIERTLGKADDVVTNAKQFNTTTENLLKVRSLGNVRGLSNESVDMLLTKFQGAVAQASLNPNDPSNSSVRNYVGQKDTAAAFYHFITELQKLDKNQQVLVQQQVFGEKQVLKMAEFLQDTGFKESADSLKKVDFGKAAAAAESLAHLADKNEANKTVRELLDLGGKAKVIGAGTVQNLNKSEINNLNRENNRIGRSDQAFSAEERMAAIQDNLEKLSNELLTKIPILFDTMDVMVGLLRKSVEGWQMIFKAIQGSPLVRGVKGLFGGKDD